jgi:SAM-dependent methyltransferase
MRSTLNRDCVVCGERGRRPVLDVDTWSIARCSGCGLHTLQPEPDAVRMEEFNDGSGYESAFGFRDAMMERNHLSLQAVERHVEPGRLLDVGCGPGFMLETARERGWNASGVDPSPFSVGVARNNGFDAYEGMLEDLSLPGGSFDAISLLQVVEHIPDPRALLAECRRLLRPGGALLVATPNPRSLLARVKRERFNYWIPPMHCAWYMPETLHRLLVGSGFAPVREETWSARTSTLHDGVDLVTSSRIGRALPFRLQRVAGEWVARAADSLGYGSITEQVALRWDEA